MSEENRDITKLLLIDEIDSGTKSENYKIDFVYNYFEKTEREFIEKKYSSPFFGLPLERIPRYIKIDFDRHIEIENYDILTEEENELSEIIDSVNHKDLKDTILTDETLHEDKISSENYFNLRFQDKETSVGFYSAVNSEVFSTFDDISTNSAINKKLSDIGNEIIIGNDDAYSGEMTQDSDFYQPVAFMFYYGIAATLHSGVFNKLDNIKINSRVNTRYVEKIISNISSDGSSPFSDEMKELQEAWQYIAEEPILDTTDNYLDFQESTPTEGEKIPTRTKVIGYIIEKYENIMSLNVEHSRKSIIKHESIYVSGTSNVSIIDRNIRYGGSYEYIIKTIVGVITSGTITQNNAVIDARLLKIFVSKGTSKRSVYCSERIPPKPPVNLYFQYNFKKDAMFINWDFPFNKQQDIKRFQIYRRNNINEPFSLLREYNFDDSTVTDGFSPASGNINNVLKLKNPRCNYYDHEFNEESKFIYSIVAIDARGLTSGYSDQFLVSYNRFTNKTLVKFISKSGAPKPYPNIFLEIDALPDVIKSNNTKKIKVYFNPTANIIRKNEISETGESSNTVVEPAFKGNRLNNVDPSDPEAHNLQNSSGEYIFQIINVNTQETSSAKINILQKDFLTVEQQLANDNVSHDSGF